MKPRILFKFINDAEYASSILGGCLKFTAIHELNDPVEMLPTWNEKAYHASLDHVRTHDCTEEDYAVWLEQQELIKFLTPDQLRAEVPPSREMVKQMANWLIYNDESLMRKRLNEFLFDLRSKLGVLSLTRGYDSLPMWAHYAANASGYLVAYKDIDDGLPKTDPPPLFHALEVDYNATAGVTYDPKTYRAIFLRKLPDWKYEKEWRVIAKLEKQQLSTNLNKTSSASRYVKMESCHVVGVFAGWRMKENDFKSLENAVRSANSQAQLIRLELDSEGWPNFSPIKEFLQNHDDVPQ